VCPFAQPAKQDNRLDQQSDLCQGNHGRADVLEERQTRNSDRNEQRKSQNDRI
jgi:hypothetical protein